MTQPQPPVQPRRVVAAEPNGSAEGGRAVSIAAVRSVVPTTAVNLRVAYGLASMPVSLELVPVHEATAEVAVGGGTALATGKVHRLAADFYARAPSVGYAGRGRSLGAGLNVRV